MVVRRKKRQARNSKARHLITKLNPRSPISEQYRTLRTNVDFSSIDEQLQSILVTSSGPGEGKSMTAANLAIVYAQQGKQILLIDADLRKPTAHYTFRLDNLRGLSNILVNDLKLESAITKSDVENLDIITSGPIPPNPAELLGSGRMKTFIENIKETYDMMIFDTPPVLAVTDAQILANLVDGSILVVRSKQTEYEEAIRAKEALEPARGKLLGAVLNDRDKSGAMNYYYYGDS